MHVLFTWEKSASSLFIKNSHGYCVSRIRLQIIKAIDSNCFFQLNGCFCRWNDLSSFLQCYLAAKIVLGTGIQFKLVCVAFDCYATFYLEYFLYPLELIYCRDIERYKDFFLNLKYSKLLPPTLALSASLYLHLKSFLDSNKYIGRTVLHYLIVIYIVTVPSTMLKMASLCDHSLIKRHRSPFQIAI